MKKLIILALSVFIACISVNDLLAQGATKIQDADPNNYISPAPVQNNTAVKVDKVNKQIIIDALYQRLDFVNASTTLTAAQKQDQIDRINAKLQELEN